MKKLVLVLAVIAMAGIASADFITDPTYSDVSATSTWLGYEGTVWSAQPLSLFVTSAGGVATVTGANANEYSFYQEFAGTLAVGDYTWTVDASNITADGGATAFVKHLDALGGWIGFEGTDALVDGSTASISFSVTDATHIYQVGTSTTGWTSGSYDLTNPSLVPEPATMGLFALAGGLLMFVRRFRS